MKTYTETKVNTYLQCPSCQDGRLFATNLEDGKWERECSVCDASVVFEKSKEGSFEVVEIKKRDRSTEKLLVLLEPVFQETFDPDEKVYLIVKTDNFTNSADIDEVRKSCEFIYNTHTCPSNYLGGTIVLEGYDDDPHGIFRFVDVVFMPEGYDSIDFHNEGRSYHELFNL